MPLASLPSQHSVSAPSRAPLNFGLRSGRFAVPPALACRRSLQPQLEAERQMSRRRTGGPGGPAEGPATLPPAPPPLDAAGEAARGPNPLPDASTSKGSLESSTAWLPGPLQPVGMLLVGFAKAAWTVAVPVARVGYRLAVWASPVLIWAFWKYINWYLLGWLNKATRIASWGKWILSFFFKAPPA